MWPAPLRKIVEARGVDAVWQTSLKLFGFPPTWLASGKEIQELLRALPSQG